jgi:TonB family protein
MTSPFYKRIAFALSILIHVLIVLGIYYHESEFSQDTSWSGGRGTTQTGTVYITISTLEVDDSVSEIKMAQKIKKITNHSTPKNSGIGHSTTPAGGTGNGLDQNGIIAQNAPHILASIRKKIVSHQSYPFTARAQRLEGSVKINFKINPDGTLSFANVSQSSGHKILDAAALKAVKKSVPLPFYPRAIALVLEYSLI